MKCKFCGCPITGFIMSNDERYCDSLCAQLAADDEFVIENAGYIQLIKAHENPIMEG